MDVDRIYNHKFPYTNFYASKVVFWRDKNVLSLLETIALSDKQIIYRWGDIPVIGGVLNHEQERIRLFPKLEYRHISHDLIIKNNFVRNLTINSKFNPISTTSGFVAKIKLWLKKWQT